MDASSVIMVIFTIILFVAVMALSLMNIVQASDKLNAEAEKMPVIGRLTGRILEEANHKTVNKKVAIAVSATAIVSLIVLTITGASAKKEAFSYLLK